MSTNSLTSNTDRVTSSDRSIVGQQPDNSTPPGSTPLGTVTNAQMAPMPANTVKANTTAGSASPTDLAMAASTILARLASGNIVAATPAQMLTLLGLSGGLSVTITTAKLTPTGANGSMTFTAGILTAQTAAT